MGINESCGLARLGAGVRVPFTIIKRGGRKLVVAPDGCALESLPRTRIDSAMVKAIARAHRWKHLLESSQYASVTEIAAAEKITHSYVCRVLRLTLLAPDIVEAILDMGGSHRSCR